MIDKQYKELLERSLEVDKVLTSKVKEAINQDKYTGRDWTGNLILTYDNLRRQNIETIIRINTYLQDKNFELKTKEEKSN